ncbi:MAG: phosphopantetheine adenylyltransferase [Myxococcales bacterium]|nr:phosphopantetheine adenylyltransferase [Deltaproteobacteria bacterium]NNE20819.1 phosphopantetheine adenylyltransferase [Myxococcales bacterium]
MTVLSTSLICIASLINLLPAIGALSSKRLQTMYGIAFEEPNLVVLMRHRAILLGIVGGLLAASAFLLPLRPAAYAAGLISMLSFVLIASLVGGYNRALRRVVLADLVASAALLFAALIDSLS